MAHARLIIVCGLPGSGKTTLAKRLETSMKAVRFCPDEWMEALSIDVRDEGRRNQVEALQWRLTQNLLIMGVPCIIEWGTWGRSERDRLRLGARALKAAVELYYLPASIDELYARLCRRGMENPPIKRKELQGWIELFQVPTQEEMALFDKCLVEPLEAL